MHHGTFLHSVSCESCVFDWKVLCALYIKRLNLWCHLYDNSTSLVINRRKSFFLYICVCFVCISHTYHASFYTLHITWTLQSCACCFLMQFFFFYRNSIQTSGAIYFNLKSLQAVVCFFVLLCSVIVFIFHFYRVFLCFDTNLQINFTWFSGKILHRYYTDFSIKIFFFQWKWVKRIFFLCAFGNCLDLYIIVLMFKVIDIEEFSPVWFLWYLGI